MKNLNKTCSMLETCPEEHVIIMVGKMKINGKEAQQEDINREDVLWDGI